MATLPTKTVGGGVSFPANTATVYELPMIGDATDMKGSGLHYVQVTVPTASVLVLADTAYEIVPAVTGCVHMAWMGQIQLNYGSIQYGETSDNLALYYENESGLRLTELIECTGFIDQAADAYTNIIGTKDRIALATAAVNKAVVLANPDGNFTSGNSSLVVSLWYTTITAA